MVSALGILLPTAGLGCACLYCRLVFQKLPFSGGLGMCTHNACNDSIVFFEPRAMKAGEVTQSGRDIIGYGSQTFDNVKSPVDTFRDATIK